RYQRCNRAFAAEVSDVDALDDARVAPEAEGFAQPGQPFFRLDLKDAGLYVLIDFATQAEAAKSAYFVAQPPRLLVALHGAGIGHRLLHLPDQLLLLSLQNHAQGTNLLAIRFLGDAEVARRRALMDAVQEARPEPAPARIVLLDVQRARAEF